MSKDRPPEGRWARRVWWVRNPLVTLLLIALFVTAASSLDTSTAGVFSRLYATNKDVDYDSKQVFLYQAIPDAGFAIFDPDISSMDGPTDLEVSTTDLFTEHAARVIQATSLLTFEQSGWGFPSRWAITRTITLEPLSTRGGKPSFTPEQLERARQTFLEFLAGKESSDPVALRLGGRNRVSGIRVANVLKNTGLLALILVTAASFAGMPRYLRVWRAHRRLRAGTCAACRYDLAGVTPTAGLVRCPECGAEWSATLQPQGLELGFPPARNPLAPPSAPSVCKIVDL